MPLAAKQLLALLNSHIAGDEEQFLSIALQVAAQEAREGRLEEAEKLKRAVQRARDNIRFGKPSGGQTPIPLARPRGELQGLMHSSYPRVTLSSMVLADDTRDRLTRIIRQQQERAMLREHSQSPARVLGKRAGISAHFAARAELDQHAVCLGLSVEIPRIAVQFLVGYPPEDGLQREGVRDQIAMVAQPPVSGGLAHAVGAQPLRQAGVAPPLAHPVSEAAS